MHSGRIYFSGTNIFRKNASLGKMHFSGTNTFRKNAFRKDIFFRVLKDVLTVERKPNNIFPGIKRCSHSRKKTEQYFSGYHRKKNNEKLSRHCQKFA